MKIAVASDHAGFELKEYLKRVLEKNHQVVDFGAHSVESADYPDSGAPAARAAQKGECERAVLVCGSGIGMSITANRFKGIRAALCHSEEIARLARAHNDANVLVLPARFISNEDAEKILRAFLETPFEGGRHKRRIEKIDILT